MRSRQARIGRALGALVVVAALAACDPPPPPAVLTVDAIGGAVDAAPGDGACETSAGECTLQAAVDEAAATHIDRIEIPAGWDVPAASVYAVDAVAPTLTITSTVAGSPVTVGGGFDLLSGGLVLSGLVLDESPVRAVDLAPATSLILNRTTISDRADVGISVETFDERTDVLLVDSRIEGGAAAAIETTHWSAHVTLVRSAIVDNVGPAMLLDWYATVDILDSEVSGNGSGISARDLDITVRRSSIVDNGGAALGTAYGDVVVEDSTVSGSTYGVYVSWGDAVVRRSTIAGNTTGIWIDTAGADVAASTLANDVDLRTAFDGGFADVGGSILGGSAGCTRDVAGEGEFTSLGGNVVADTSCGFASGGDQQGVDPLLGALGDNGGPTPTMLPAPGSPAIDAIPTGTATLCTSGMRDQRGVLRPIGSACDVGAVEQ